MAVLDLATLTCLLGAVLGTANGYTKKIPYIPAGTYMTAPDVFIGGEPADSSVPYCKSNEPCGYYTFDLQTKRPLKWIPSWCQCNSNQNCIYSGLNKRQRTYVHSCADDTQPEGRLLFLSN